MTTRMFNKDDAPLPPIEDFLQADTGSVIDYLVNEQHVELRRMMTRLRALAVEAKVDSPRPSDDIDRVAQVLADFEEVVIDHIKREEQIVFPLIAILQGRDALPLYSRMNVQSPVIRLESDHDDTSTVFETLRELTDGYAPKPDESAAYSALITGLATFEALLRHHIGLERYALFARICEKI